MASGVKDTMESNAVNLDSYLLKNREVMLENAMVEQWSGIRKESTYLNQEMSEFLRENAVDIKAFSARRDLQKNLCTEGISKTVRISSPGFCQWCFSYCSQ